MHNMNTYFIEIISRIDSSYATIFNLYQIELNKEIKEKEILLD